MTRRLIGIAIVTFGVLIGLPMIAVAQPTVTSIDPATGPITGGSTLTIEGTNFATAPGATTVTIGGNAATVLGVHPSGTMMGVTTPAHAAGPVAVVVTTAAGTANIANGFTYVAVPPPSITSVSPTSGSTVGGTQVVLTGAGFTPSATVTFGGTAATILGVNPDGTHMAVKTPAHAAGQVNVAVTTGIGTGTLANGYQYQVMLTVSGVSPGAGPLAGGTSVTITGTLFGAAQGTGTVTFGGVAAAAVTLWSGGSITAVAPAAPGGNAGKVAVVVAKNGQQASGLFTYAPPPSIGSLSPNSGSTSGSAFVEIRGIGFRSDATVSFDGGVLPGASVNVIDSHRIVVQSPAHAAGTVPVVVTSAAQSSPAVNFTYAASPTVVAVDQPSGPQGGGTTINIFADGAIFDPGAAVSVGGVAATNVNIVNPSQISAVTPAHTVGLKDISVVSAGNTYTLSNGFRYLGPAPTVSAVTPPGAAISGGAVATITGTGFLAGASVLIGDTAATVTSVSTNQVTATLPSVANAGFEPVSIFNPDGQFAFAADGIQFFEPGPFCGAAVTVNCIVTFSITNPNNPTNIIPTVSSFGSSLTIALLNTNGSGNSQYELAPTLKTDPVDSSVVQMTIRVGTTFDPTVMISTGHLISWQFNANTDEVTFTANPRRSSWNRQQGCTPTLCPTVADADHQAFLLAAIQELSAPPGQSAITEQLTFDEALQGGFLATNGQYFSPPQYDATTGSISFQVGSPSLGADGVTVNQGFVRFFVPDAFITSQWGVPNPADLLNVNNSQVTVAGQLVTPVISQVAATVVGGVLVSPAGLLFQFENFHFSVDDIAITIAPTVSSISPTAGVTTGGTAVTITGLNFRSGATVTIGGVAATSVVVVNSTTITAVTGVHAAPGATNVVVTNSDTTTDTLASAFTYALISAFTTHPVSQSVSVGQNAQFTGVASGNPAPTLQWQISTNGGSTWTSLTNAAPYSGVTTGTLTITAAAATLANARYRLVATNTAGATSSNAATLSVFTAATLNPASLSFTATKNGAAGDLAEVTAPQSVQISFAGSAAAWTVTADQPWIQISSASGTGSGNFTIAIVNPGNVLGASTDVSATITVSASSFGLTTTLPVGLSIRLNPDDSVPPFGFFDTPLEGATGIIGSIGVTGWALDDVGVQSVKIYRNCLGIDNPASCQDIAGANVVFVGDAVFLAGARPDVEALHPDHPQAHRAGWGFLMLTNMLPHIPNGNAARGGQGTITIYAHAIDVEGHGALLGSRTITLDNDNIARPFGVLDTPAPGTTVSGTFPNFGWALTPGTAIIPTDGSTMRVVVDGVSIGNVTYNQCRLGPTNLPPVGTCQDDVATLFPGHTNITNGRGAIGSFDINTTLLSNGLHTIAWGVVDNQGRTEGIGSRFFTVSNGSSLVSDSAASLNDAPASVIGHAVDVQALSMSAASMHGRLGFAAAAPLERIDADGAGIRRVTLPELGRLELVFSDQIDRGYLVANGTLRPLPPGSAFDPATSRFTWVPGAGYIGTYDLVFLQDEMQLPISVEIHAKQAEQEGQIRGHIDLPSASTTVSGSFVVAGWALDLAAWQGSGVGAVHVWAQRRDVPAASPIFLGAADIDGARPDVATHFGAQFDRAGWGLTAAGLERGEYDVTAYFWSTRTQQFEDARTVPVSIR